MKYQPVGCQDIPWQEWYFKNTSGFTTVPSERSLATAYYAKEVQASLFDFKRVVVSRGCTDCNTCPRDYYIATVKGSDAEKMRNTGWAQV